MDAPELTTFGSLIRYAVTLEAATASFYREAAAAIGAGDAADLARRLAEEHEGRRQLLERTRQQKLNEMVLEPISGLDGTRYRFDATVGSPADARPKAVALEQVAALLYNESAVVARSLLTEAARTFRKLGEENGRNLALLNATFPP